MESEYMRARRRLTPASLLILFPLLVLLSCSGAGTESAPAQGVSPVVESKPIVAPPSPAELLWRSDHALIRSRTDGSGVITLVDTPAFEWGNEVFLNGSTVVYHLTAPPLPPMTTFGLTDIWQIQTTGTGNKPVVASIDADIIRDTFGPWVLYEKVVYVNGTLSGEDEYRSARFDGTGQGLVTDAHALYRLHLGERAVFERVEQSGGGGLFSVLLDGTDLRELVDKPSGSVGTTYLTPFGTIGTQVLFARSTFPQGLVDLFVVPVAGGPVTTLVEGPDYKAIGAVIGSRIIYQRCPFTGVTDEFGNPIAGPCNIYSVLSDGTGTVALATTPDNETVQGVIGERIIVRRNGGGSDSLFSIPAGGGVETPMLTLDAQTEFVSAIVGDRVILRRPSGLWTLTADGSGLAQLTQNPADHADGATGSFFCFQRGPYDQSELWCIPADGSGPATKVATDGHFVKALKN